MGGVAALAIATPDEQLLARGGTVFGRSIAGEPQTPSLLRDGSARWLLAAIGPEGRTPPRAPSGEASLAVAFHGEIHNAAELSARLPARHAPDPVAGTHGALLAALFDEFGPSILREVHGTYQAIVVSARDQRVHLLNDRLGSYPLYWTADAGRLVAAPTVSGVLANLNTPPTLDRRAVAEYVHFGLILGNRTLARGVELVPPASVVSWSFAGGHVETTKYWRLEEAFGSWAGDRTEYLRALREAFNAAVERSAASAERVGMSLSGGLDSRAILSALAVYGRKPVTYTLGVTGCADESIANTLSRLASTTHHFVELDEQYLGEFLPNLERMVELTDGMYLSHGLTEMLAVRGLKQLSIDVLLRGHCGELAKTSLAWPFQTDARMYAARDRDEFLSYLAERANYVSRGVPPADLFAGDFAEAQHTSIESLREVVRDVDLTPAQLCSYVYIDSHQRRFTVPSLELFRTRVSVALPFADTAFLDVLLRGPAEWRDRTDIHRFIIGRNDARLLAVRNSNTGAPGNAGPILEAVLDKLNTVLKRLNVRGYRHYHRLDEWMNRQLHAAVQTVLLDPDTLARGIFRERTVRRLIEETRTGGADRAHLLEVMLHVELWQRQNT